MSYPDPIPKPRVLIDSRGHQLVFYFNPNFGTFAVAVRKNGQDKFYSELQLSFDSDAEASRNLADLMIWASYNVVNLGGLRAQREPRRPQLGDSPRASTPDRGSPTPPEHSAGPVQTTACLEPSTLRSEVEPE